MRYIRNRIERALEKLGKKGVTSRELFKATKLKRMHIGEFYKELDVLKKDGVVFEKKGRIYTKKTPHLYSAKIVKVTATFGFAQSLANEENEIFIPGKMLMGAMPGDVVMLEPMPGKGDLPVAKVKEILVQADYTFTGVIRQEGNRVWVVSDKDSFSYDLDKKGIPAGIKDNDKVLARICIRGNSHYDHKAEILQNFGSADSAKNSSLAILMSNGIQTEFSAEVLKEAELLNDNGIAKEEMAKRTDLRDKIIFTIDSADTKDIDDAISIEKNADGWVLGVHIADVSHYVTPGSALDEEAFARGTSIYYANSVIPMLPKALSNGICSLNAGEDRLAFSVFMQIDANGNRKSYHFEKTIIRSVIKGVYQEINTIFDGSATSEIKKKYASVENDLWLMKQLADLLNRKRREKGVLDLSSLETKIIIDEEGRAVDIQPRHSGISEQMIEEFMLMANCAAAEFSFANQLPFIYRVHEKPSLEKLQNLKQLLDSLGVPCPEIKEDISSAELSAILQKVKETPLEKIVNNQILRSMAKARYSEKNIGHYGLVTEKYSHFTSPIRRYPDLAIHRIMTAQLEHHINQKALEQFQDFVARASVQSSEREIISMNIERDCDDCYKAEYMRAHLGELYEGVISSVKQFGIYVELPNTAEGLIRIEHLPADEYEYDGLISLLGKNTEKRFRVGDAIKIKVAAADVSSGKVDFEYVE